MNSNLKINDETSFKPNEQRYISQNDFIYFKNELLKEINTMETKLLSILKTNAEQNELKIFTINSKLNSFQTKILELSVSISSDNSQIDKVKELFIFKSNIEEKISLQEKKIKDLNDYLNKSIYSMNKTIQDNINYPGVIGSNSKFQNFHSFIDFTIENINNINSFKDKMVNLNMLNYKMKFDKIKKSYKVQMDSFINSSQNMIKESLVIYDKKINHLLNAFDTQILEVKDLFQEKIDKISEKYNKLNSSLSSIKDEILKKLDLNKDEFNKKIENINLRNDKCNSDLDNINKKLEEMNGFIKFKNTEYDKKLDEQETKLTSKIYNLFSLYKKRGNLPIQKNNQMDNYYKTFLYKDNFYNKEFNIFTSSDTSLKETFPGDSRLKKNNENENSNNENISNKEIKKLENTSNDNENNINKNIEKGNFSSMNNNIKYIELNNDSINNNQENSDNKLFIDVKKADSYIIEKEKIIIDKSPRNQLIKNLIKTVSEPIPNHFIQNKIKKNKILKKIHFNQNNSLTSKRKIIGYNTNNSFMQPFNNNTSKLILQKKFEGNYCIDNVDLEDLNDKIYKRSYSSENSKTRNEQNSIINYNISNLKKDNNKIINDNKDNNINIIINNNNLDKSISINNILDKSINNNLKINKNIFRKDENKESEYNKKNNKIIHNINSASKLLDSNIKNENLFYDKYKINQLQKNIKIIKNPGSPLNQTMKLKLDKEKDITQRPGVHYYLNMKNKNKK